jgi:hypothetical protein
MHDAPSSTRKRRRKREDDEIHGAHPVREEELTGEALLVPACCLW